MGDNAGGEQAPEADNADLTTPNRGQPLGPGRSPGHTPASAILRTRGTSLEITLDCFHLGKLAPSGTQSSIRARINRVIMDTEVVPDTTNDSTKEVKKLMAKFTTDSIVKALQRDMDSTIGTKTFSGDGKHRIVDFYFYTTNLSITLTDLDTSFGPVLSIDTDITAVAQAVNEKVYMVLYKTTSGSAKDIVMDHVSTRDGRKALLYLYKEFRPMSRHTTTEIKEGIRAIRINGKKHPKSSITTLQQYGRHLNTIFPYAEEQVVADILGSLGSDYKDLVVALDVEDCSGNGEDLTVNQLKERIFTFYNKHNSTFRGSGKGADDSLAAVTSPTPTVPANSDLKSLTESIKKDILAAVSPAGDFKKKKKDKGAEKDPKKPKGKDPPNCTVCGEGVNHWFKDCPVIKKAKEMGLSGESSAPANDGTIGAVRFGGTNILDDSDSDDEAAAPMLHSDSDDEVPELVSSGSDSDSDDENWDLPPNSSNGSEDELL